MAKKQKDLEKSIEFLYQCQEPKMAQLESIPSRVDAPEFKVQNKPAMAHIARTHLTNTSPKK